jgi:DNA-binding response OmpR family regulator
MYSVAVLDDDMNLTESVVDYLNLFGFDAIGFVTAEQLIASNAAKPFDAVVSDWCLGQATQEDTIRQLRASPGFGANPILVLTGWDVGTPQHDRLRAAASIFHLAMREKPYGTKELANDLLALIEGRQKYDHRPRYVRGR